MENIKKLLKIEREKLDCLVDEALKKGTSISETRDIMEQSNKVNKLLERVMKEKTEGE